ncbi:MAG TPA: beta-galactosidase [Tepidisphaeraceae bacterium]|nr:beta-galactosidase [Tepidisphaeraceae bacterium]
MKHFLRSATLLTVGLLLMGCSHAIQKDHVFPLGLWYEGGVGDARDNVLPKDPKQAAPVYDRNFADIAAHNINVVVVPNSPPDHHKPLLDAAAAHHLLVIPELGLDGGPIGNMIRGGNAVDPAVVQQQFKDVLDPIKNHPAFWRVQLLDEPAGGPPMKNYATVAAALNAHDPKIKPFCCLAGPGPVHEFVQVVRPDVAAFDFYPIGNAKPANDLQGIRDFENASAASVGEARKVGADCWAVIQCHAITGILRYPSPTEVRAMTWVSLGTGAKGVFWFLYQTEHFTQNQVMDGLVDRDFNARPDWDEVGRLAKELKLLTPTLINLKPAADEKPTVIRRKSMYPMVDIKGHKYLLAVNVDPGEHQTLHLSLKTTAKKVVRLPDNKLIPSVRKGDMLTWHEDFEPGSGALYRVE